MILTLDDSFPCLNLLAIPSTVVPSLWSVNVSIFITSYNQNHKSKGFLHKPTVLCLPLQVEMPFYSATHPENTKVRGPSFVSPTVQPPSTGNSLLHQILKTWWSRVKRSMRHKIAHALHSNRIVFWATTIGQLCPESGYGWTGNQRKATKCSCRVCSTKNRWLNSSLNRDFLYLLQ